MRRLPAEWEPQAGAMLVWPHEESDWAEKLAAIEATYEQIARVVLEYEPLLVLCRHRAQREDVAARLAGAPHPLYLHEVPTDDTWIRDFGPIGVLERDRPYLLDFHFNAWGGKYPHSRDDRATTTLCTRGAFGDTPCEKVDLVLEGGAIESNGHGILAANRPTLLDPRRNPGVEPEELQERLRHLFGLRRILWLDVPPLAGDDTDGHIDTLARFVAPGRICHAACDDPRHPDHSTLKSLAAQIAQWRDEDDRPFECIPLPHPDPVRERMGRPLPASYANFVLLEGAVLVPQYGSPQDEAALEVLRRCFPQRHIHPIDSRTLVSENGSLHCATMTLPTGVDLV